MADASSPNLPRLRNHRHIPLIVLQQHNDNRITPFNQNNSGEPAPELSGILTQYVRHDVFVLVFFVTVTCPCSSTTKCHVNLFVYNNNNNNNNAMPPSLSSNSSQALSTFPQGLPCYLQGLILVRPRGGGTAERNMKNLRTRTYTSCADKFDSCL